MSTPRGLIRKLRRVQADAYNDLQKQVWASQRSVRRLIQDAASDTPNLADRKAQQAIFRAVGGTWETLSVDLESWFKDLTFKVSPTFQEAAIERMARGGNPVVRYSRERAERVFEMMHPANGDRIAGVFTDKMTETNLNALRQAVIEAQRAASVEGWTSRRIHKEIQDRWTALAQGMVPRVATHGFTDVSGRTWDNARYLNMLTRTTTARIARESYMQTLADAGDDLMRIEAVGDTCPTCLAWDGVIVSISGTNPKFPSYQDAIQAGWGHPNCDCLTTSVDEDLDAEEVQAQEEVENVDWTQRERVAEYRDRGKGGGNQSKSIAEVVSENGVQIERNKNEVFMVLNQDGTERFKPFLSGPSGGNLPKEWTGKMDGAVFVHNHPSGLMPGRNGYGTSFSPEDIMTAAHQKLSAMSAVSPRRDYIMRPGPGGWPDEAKIRSSYLRQEGIQFQAAQRRVLGGRLTIDQAEMIHMDMVWKKVAADLGMDYTVVRKP